MSLKQRLAADFACASATPLHEKTYSSLAALVAILALMSTIHLVSSEFTFTLLVLASMGASAFLLFAVPHSLMAQPWPLVGGHLVSAALGILCARWLPGPELAAAAAVALTIFAMHWLRCLHPPSAATAMIAVLGGPQVQAIGWKFCYEVVALNVAVMLLLALVINNVIPGRRYPLRHTHHSHHAQFQSVPHAAVFPELTEADFAWALRQMDAVIDISQEDLIDIYEFAVEHAQTRVAQAAAD
jgi:CBS-domain-containing membrane protein